MQIVRTATVFCLVRLFLYPQVVTDLGNSRLLLAVGFFCFHERRDECCLSPSSAGCVWNSSGFSSPPCDSPDCQGAPAKTTGAWVSPCRGDEVGVKVPCERIMKQGAKKWGLTKDECVSRDWFSSRNVPLHSTLSLKLFKCCISLC